MQMMCDIFQEIGLPPGVVNVIHGHREIAETWYEDPRIAGVCLVGSTPTAKKMAAGCARSAKRSMLLGDAKNMLVVMEDADMDVFIDNYLNSCFGSAGQRCLAGSIVAIVPKIYEQVLKRMIAASKTVIPRPESAGSPAYPQPPRQNVRRASRRGSPPWRTS